jgi:hypothetical protein
MKSGEAAAACLEGERLRLRACVVPRPGHDMERELEAVIRLWLGRGSGSGHGISPGCLIGERNIHLHQYVTQGNCSFPAMVLTVRQRLARKLTMPEAGPGAGLCCHSAGLTLA